MLIISNIAVACTYTWLQPFIIWKKKKNEMDIVSWSEEAIQIKISEE